MEGFGGLGKIHGMLRFDILPLCLYVCLLYFDLTAISSRYSLNMLLDNSYKYCIVVLYILLTDKGTCR